jgi:hypothetical protein
MLSARTLVLAGCTLMTTVALTAQQAPPGAPAGPGGAQTTMTNLKVLPKTWTRQQVGALMQTFTTSLGVQCGHCHTPDPAAPPPNPGQNPRYDYALDDKPEKDIARKMIQMVMDINGTDLSGVGDAAVAEKVSCFTCHRGETTAAKAPAEGWGRGDFSLSEAGPVVPQRGRGAGRGGPPAGAPPAGGGGN